MTEREKKDFNEIKKKITVIPCLAHSAKDRNNIVSTDASRSGLGIILEQKQNDDTIRPIAFAIRYLNDAQKNYSIKELKLLAVVWELEKFRLYLYSKVVHLYTDDRALKPLIKRNPAYRQYNAQLTRWLG